MKKFTLALLTFVMIFSFAGVAIVGADHDPNDLKASGALGHNVKEIPTLSTTQLFTKFQTIANWLFTVLVVLSVFMILVAAFQFVTGGDNPETLSAARQKIIWAAVGLIIALLARAIPTIIVSALGKPPTP